LTQVVPPVPLVLQGRGKGVCPGGSPATAATAATAVVEPTGSLEGTVGNLWELLQKGGWAMIPLGVLSVIAGMLIVGFALTIRRGMVVSKQYLTTVEVLIRKKDYLGVLAVSNRRNESLARVVQRALDFATRTPASPLRVSRKWPKPRAAPRPPPSSIGSPISQISGSLPRWSGFSAP
jgi:hypothetical protein